MLAILKKEIKSYFLSPIGYVFIGLFLFMASIFFYVDVIYYGSMNFEYMFFSLSTILTFVTPLLTMRMFAEEKRNGTDQLLFTSPVSMGSIVIAKFLAAVFILLISELLTFIYYLILMHFGTPYLPTALNTLFGFLLLGMAYISFGMFASSITENQIVASIVTIAFFILTWFMPGFNENLEAFSLINMFEKFPSGQIALNELVTYITFTLLFTLLTMIVLQRKKELKIERRITLKKFLEIIKKKWLIDNTKTAILVAFLIVVFLFINIGVNNLDLQAIDITRNKLYSLSDDTKNKISEVKQNVSIYFFGINDSYSIVDLAKQYSNINDKIEVLVVDSAERPDLYEKYEVTDSSSQGIVIQAPERYKILSLNDLTEYNYTTYETVDVSEQKLTNAIIDTTIAKKPKIYFLSGHDETSDIQIFKTFLANEVNDISTLNLLSSDLPNDCDLLFISNPQKDFADYETDKIINYINNGGNIMWLSNGINPSFTNIKKILALYGADILKGIIRET